MGKHLKEFVSHTSIWAMALIAVVTWVLTVPELGTGGVWLAVLVGVAVFFTSEYTTHRFLFHMKPPKHPFLLKLLRQLHYDHHEFPGDLHLLFLPLWYSLINYSALWGLTWLVTGSSVLATAVTAGAVTSLLYYEWVHYAAHRPVKLLTPWGRWMKKYHLWHHYKSEQYWFGVTNPLLDTLLGTRKEEKQVEMSPTARNLYQKEM